MPRCFRGGRAGIECHRRRSDTVAPVVLSLTIARVPSGKNRLCGKHSPGDRSDKTGRAWWKTAFRRGLGEIRVGRDVPGNPIPSRVSSLPFLKLTPVRCDLGFDDKIHHDPACALCDPGQTRSVPRIASGDSDPEAGRTSGLHPDPRLLRWISRTANSRRWSSWPI